MLNLSQINLTSLRYAVSQRVARKQIQDAEVSLEECFDVDALVLRLKTKIWATEISVEETRHPADWWEACKERWFPRWALRRWPVRYRVFDVTAYHKYPKLRLQDSEPRLAVFAQERISE